MREGDYAPTVVAFALKKSSRLGAPVSGVQDHRPSSVDSFFIGTVGHEASPAILKIVFRDRICEFDSRPFRSETRSKIHIQTYVTRYAIRVTLAVS